MIFFMAHGVGMGAGGDAAVAVPNYGFFEDGFGHSYLELTDTTGTKIILEI